MIKLITALLLGALLLTGCGQRAGKDAAGQAQAVMEQEKPAAASDATNIPEVPQADPKTTIDLTLKPNEAGKIMVLMYHKIGPVESEWVRTPANFRRDLATLYAQGYRPVSLKDYVSGQISTAPGFSPVVLTFDDGNLSDFAYLDDGSINPDCAVGILLDFHAQHPDFPLEATFFLFGERPFRQKGLVAQKLNFILDQGMDIGNHTRTHPNLKHASPEEIEREIGAEAQFLQGQIDGTDYEIDALAMPFGTWPQDEALHGYLSAGVFKGIPYRNRAVLKVGWNPAPSPYAKQFDPLKLPRVRASETKVDGVGLYNYLKYFGNNPQERFISDGVAEVITVPAAKADAVAASPDKEIYTY